MAPRSLQLVFIPLLVLCFLQGAVCKCSKTNQTNTRWIVFQRRTSPDFDFYRNWAEYEQGFGDLDKGNFWLGLAKLHKLTSEKQYQLRIEFSYKKRRGPARRYFADYQYFKILGKSQNYTLNVYGYSGNAGDALSYSNGMAFSTKDKDNDRMRLSCAKWSKGAWWYRSCHKAHLNGRWTDRTYAKGLVWHPLGVPYFARVTNTTMKIKPRNSDIGCPPGKSEGSQWTGSDCTLCTCEGGMPSCEFKCEVHLTDPSCMTTAYKLGAYRSGKTKDYPDCCPMVICT